MKNLKVKGSESLATVQNPQPVRDNTIVPGLKLRKTFWQRLSTEEKAKAITLAIITFFVGGIHYLCATSVI